MIIMTPIISIGTGNFYYWKLSLVEKLRYLQDIEGVHGIEISCVPHGTQFSHEEISLLSRYTHNTIHLWKYDFSDNNWMMYCRETIPNFQHFVLHPNDANLEDINIETESWISFENMDPRKSAYQKPKEMQDLFKRFPRAKFTLDINHADENNIPRNEFQIVQMPSQIHFSTVNNHFYPTYPEIDTPHALAHLDPTFDRNITAWV